MPKETTAITAGDHVVLDHPDISDRHRNAVFTVDKVNKVNLQLTPVGGGTTIQAPKDIVRHATTTEREKAEAAARSRPAPLYLGSVVTTRGRAGLYVVIGLPGGRSDRYRAVPLGGTQDGTYLAGPRPVFDLVDTDKIRVA